MPASSQPVTFEDLIATIRQYAKTNYPGKVVKELGIDVLNEMVVMVTYSDAGNGKRRDRQTKKQGG
jgi:hypothetical protein